MEQTPGASPGTALLTQTWSNHNGVYKRTATTLSLTASPSKTRSAAAAPPVEQYLNTVEELGTDGNLYITKRTLGTRTTYRWDKGEVPLTENSAVAADGTPLPKNITTEWTYHPDRRHQQPNHLRGQPARGLTTTTRENGIASSFETDLLSQETKTIAGNGAVINSIYNPAGQLLKTVLPDGETQLYQYEPDGTVISGLDLDGDNVLNPAVDRMSRTLKTFDASWPENKGSWKTETQLAWQGNWITQSTQWATEDGTSTRTQTLGVAGYTTGRYPSASQKGATYTETETSSDRQTRETTYTLNKGNITAIATLWKDAEGQTVTTSSTTYNTWGNIMTQTDVRTGETTFTRDGTTGTLLTLTTPDGAATSYQYDPLGRQTGITLPDGCRQHTEYDTENRPVRQWGSGQYPVSHTYDPYGRRTALTTYRSPVGNTAAWPENSEGDTTRWTYDPQTGQLTGKTYADGSTLAYTYTPGGKPLTRTNARGATTTYTYNQAGDLTALTCSDNGLTPAQRSAWDQWGRPVTIETEGVAAYTYTWNPRNELTQEHITLPTANGALERTIERLYDNQGRTSGYRLKQGGTIEQTIACSYTPANLLSSLIADDKPFTYTHIDNAPHLLAGMTSPVHTVTNTWETNRDTLSNKTNTWKNKTDNPVISNYTYTVNNLGQRTAVTTTGETFAQSPADWTWTYDALGQITKANTDQYTYDQIGNRLTSGKQNGAQTAYTANALNQYTAVNTTQPAYDADGNQLTGLTSTAALPDRNTLTFTWNADNRPVALRQNGELKETRTYDHMGRRIRKGDTLTLYDGYNAIAEYNLNTRTLKTTYEWGNDLSGTPQGAGGVGGLLSVTEHDKQTPLVSYPCYDGNGNITEYLTEENGGPLAAHYEYDAFGNVTQKTGEKEYNYQFSTKPYDSLTGLNYYNYRDYDPINGRWINRDPIEETGGMNLYGFVKNKPLFFIDILGLRIEPDSSNCLGYALTGESGQCFEPDQGQSMKDFVEKSGNRKCNEIKDTNCKCEKKKTPILIFLYTPESYKGDPWTTPQDWTPPADFHAMRNPSNKGWMEVSNVERGNVPPVLKNPEHFLNRAEDRLRKLKEKKKIKIICCCEDCD